MIARLRQSVAGFARRFLDNTPINKIEAFLFDGLRNIFATLGEGRGVTA